MYDYFFDWTVKNQMRLFLRGKKRINPKLFKEVIIIQNERPQCINLLSPIDYQMSETNTFLNALNNDNLLNTLNAQSINKNITDTGLHNASNILSNLQHQSIDKNITDNSGRIISEISSTDKDLSKDISQSTLGIRDSIGSNCIGLRDAIERNGINISSNLTTMGQYNADRTRDIQTTIERNGQLNSSATERNASLILQSSGNQTRDIISDMNRNDTETLSQLNRNNNGIITNMNRNDNELLTSIERNGNANVVATNASAFETRTLINTTHNAISSQNAAQYASVLLEQQKLKELLARQASENFTNTLLEQHKLKESISYQAALHFSTLQMDQQKSKECISFQLAEAKYESLKNKMELSAQMCDSFCDVKNLVRDSSNKLDDSIRCIESQRLRDALAVEKNENNIFKILGNRRDDHYHRDDRHCHPYPYPQNIYQHQGPNSVPLQPSI
jgi:hypothetical protein